MPDINNDGERDVFAIGTTKFSWNGDRDFCRKILSASFPSPYIDHVNSDKGKLDVKTASLFALSTRNLSKKPGRAWYHYADEVGNKISIKDGILNRMKWIGSGNRPRISDIIHSQLRDAIHIPVGNGNVAHIGKEIEIHYKEGIPEDLQRFSDDIDGNVLRAYIIDMADISYVITPDNRYHLNKDNLRIYIVPRSQKLFPRGIYHYNLFTFGRSGYRIFVDGREVR